MFVDAVVNGVPVTKSQFVSVVSCLTGNPLLDNSRIRRGLRDAWNASNPNGPAADRRERGGWQYRDASGALIEQLLPPDPTGTPCSYQFPSGLGAMGTPVVTWHTHPFRPLDATDPLPNSCYPNAAPPPPGTVRVAAARPSNQDFQVGGASPHFVVDANNVWYVPDPANAPGVFTGYPRQGTGCDPLSP